MMSKDLTEEDDSEPPPLEDMKEELERMGRGRQLAPMAKSKESVTLNKGNASKGHGKAASAIEANIEHHNNKTKERQQGGSGFGGFQKGFLSGSKPAVKVGVSSSVASSSSSQSKSSTEESIDLMLKMSRKGDNPEDDIIRPKVSGKNSGLEFPEVQEAMKELNPLLATDKWLTDDLLDKIEKDPLLSKAFHDPGMTPVLHQLQTNPQQALDAARGNPELQKFLQSFCALMGDHFSAIGEGAEEEGPVQGIPGAQVTSEEEARVKSIISKPEVRSALEDPLVKQLIQMLKTNATAAQQFISDSRSLEFNSKIKILIDNGLLSLK